MGEGKVDNKLIGNIVDLMLQLLFKSNSGCLCTVVGARVKEQIQWDLQADKEKKVLRQIFHRTSTRLIPTNTGVR